VKGLWRNVTSVTERKSEEAEPLWEKWNIEKREAFFSYEGKSFCQKPALERKPERSCHRKKLQHLKASMKIAESESYSAGLLISDLTARKACGSSWKYYLKCPSSENKWNHAMQWKAWLWKCAMAEGRENSSVISVPLKRKQRREAWPSREIEEAKCQKWQPREERKWLTIVKWL